MKKSRGRACPSHPDLHRRPRRRGLTNADARPDAAWRLFTTFSVDAVGAPHYLGSRRFRGPQGAVD
ncbi:hypothetical protein LUTEI9C_80276 [Luteimonas sp. 9C]|nr:hypothetical protein LUTEI9C_80276 [Luteimonas sp. 9C]